MQVQTGVQLPVSPQQVDGSCFNQGLPQNNDKWPQVQFNPGADTQLGSYAIALFRTYAQTRATKSPIHCFCYNMLQMNQFNNQFWQGWCQYVVDFADFLQRGQNQPPQQAADKAASRIYQSMLATVAGQYPAVRGMLDAQTQNGLNDAATVANAIQNDINMFKQRLASGGNMGVGGGLGVGVGAGGVNHTQHVNAFAVSGVGVSTNTYNNPSAPVSGGNSGLLLGTEAPVSKPTSSWPAPAPGAPAQQAQGLAPAAGAPAIGLQKAAASDVIDHIHNAPISVEDIKIDPNFYVPKGFTPVPGRPYDVIRNPGGVEIRPAYQVLKSKDAASWRRTVGQDAPYSKLYNPNTHICFLAKWVDGIVKEVVVPLLPEMDYAKHEINEDLRRKAMRPIGINVPLPQYTVAEDLKVKTIVDTKQALDDGVVQAAHLSPVELEGYITGTTDLENEAAARAQVVSLLGLKPEDPVPPHEYLSAKMHELQITEECFNELYALQKATKPQEVVDGLRKLVESGMLSARYYTFINTRLTKAVNDFLRDSLSIEKIRIADYMDAAVDLGPYLAKKRGQEYETVYVGNTASIVGRSLAVACEETASDVEGEEPTKAYGIVDEYLNFQLGLPSDELSNIGLTEEACLVSQFAHPVMISALRAMAQRSQALEINNRVHMRLITSDGFYYQVIIGKLVKGALLLKKA
jgi:hypothetical protein